MWDPLVTAFISHEYYVWVTYAVRDAEFRIWIYALIKIRRLSEAIRCDDWLNVKLHASEVSCERLL